MVPPIYRSWSKKMSAVMIVYLLKNVVKVIYPHERIISSHVREYNQIIYIMLLGYRFPRKLPNRVFLASINNKGKFSSVVLCT